MTRVAVIGGGLAGLAAAVAAAEHGLEVELFEARRRLGGRAGSFVDPQSGQLVDHCQHVAMGCCTNWLDFCRRTGIDDCFERHRRLWFIGPDGRTYTFGSAPLPAPFHLLPSLLRLGYLSLKERLGIVRAMAALLRNDGGARFQRADNRTARWKRAPQQEEIEETIGAWLRRHGQSERAIAWFWSVVLVSALSESLDRASLSAARKVFRDGFLTHRRAYELYLPRVSLGEIYDRRLAAWLAAHGVAVHLGARVQTLEADSHRASALVPADGSRREFDFFVVAVPWRDVRGLFPAAVLDAMPELEGVDAIPAAPIAALHLWFDRPLMALPHAVLVGRLGQWIFSHPGSVGRTEGSEARRDGKDSPAGVAPLRPPYALHEHYYQVVISAAHDIRPSARDEVLAQVLSELEAIWPAACDARLLRWRMVVQPNAVFSVQPGIDQRRPRQSTSLSNVMLAGDWTRTGWPATMEGAIRSGYLAVAGIEAGPR
jgi:squalene-associated FAD-dependent desaturase